MNIYIDESGSINNKNCSSDPFFVVALIHVKDKEKLKRAYKRFISSNLTRLEELDCDRFNGVTGRITKSGGKMFSDGKFKELKGTQLDPDMKRKFIEYITRGNYFEVFFIRINNSRLSDAFCENTARVFNYTVCLALKYFIVNQHLPNEDCNLQLDERNEKTETKHFLENYLNTELTMSGVASGKFSVIYFDSACNQFIQIADVFANFYYSHLRTNAYSKEFAELRQNGIMKFVFDFPPNF